MKCVALKPLGLRQTVTPSEPISNLEPAHGPSTSSSTSSNGRWLQSPPSVFTPPFAGGARASAAVPALSFVEYVARAAACIAEHHCLACSGLLAFRSKELPSADITLNCVSSPSSSSRKTFPPAIFRCPFAFVSLRFLKYERRPLARTNHRRRHVPLLAHLLRYP